MSWTDEELDDLFRSVADKGGDFSYKESYWDEMEALLPGKAGGKDFLWYFTAFLFTSLLTVAFFTRKEPISQKATVLTADANKELETIRHNSTSEAIERTPELQEKAPTSNIGSEDTKRTVRANNGPRNEDQGSVIENALSNPFVFEQEQSFQAFNVEGMDRNPIQLIEKDLDLYPLPLHEKAKSGGVGHAFFIQSMFGVSQSLINPAEHDSWSVGIGGGVALRKKNFVANFGLNAILSNHKDLSLTRSAKVYGFGSSLYRYDFDYKQLIYTEGLFEFGYQHKRSEFKLGLRPSYLMSSRVQISSTQYNELSGSETWTEDQQVYSFTKGLKRWGLKPTFGYAYHLQPDLEIGMQVGTQLMKTIDEVYIQGEANPFPWDAQFYIRKNIGWKRHEGF